PTVVLSPALVFQENAGKDGAQPGIFGAGCNRPDVFGRKVIRDLEHVGEIIEQIVFVAADNFVGVQFGVGPIFRVEISTREVGPRRRLVWPAVIAGIVFFKVGQEIGGLFKILDDVVVIHLHVGGARNIGVLVVLTVDDRNARAVVAIVIGQFQVH